MVEINAETFLIGQDRNVSTTFLELAIGLGLLGMMSALVGHYVTTPLLAVGGRISMILVPIFCLLAAYQGYRNQGLVVSFALVFAPLFTMIAHGFGVGIFSEPTPLEWLLMGVRVGGSIALALGTLMFLIGIGARLVTDWNQTRGNDPKNTA